MGDRPILVPAVGMKDSSARDEIGYLDTISTAARSPERPSPFRPTQMCGHDLFGPCLEQRGQRILVIIGTNLQTENITDHLRVLNDIDAEDIHAGPDEVGRFPASQQSRMDADHQSGVALDVGYGRGETSKRYAGGAVTSTAEQEAEAFPALQLSGQGPELVRRLGGEHPFEVVPLAVGTPQLALGTGDRNRGKSTAGIVRRQGGFPASSRHNIDQKVYCLNTFPRGRRASCKDTGQLAHTSSAV